MEQNTPVVQKRRYRRKNVDMLALIKVGTIHQGRGHTKNISLKGVLVENRTIFAHIRPNRVPELLNTQIKISFPQESLTVVGKIVRLDQAQGNIAIEIVSTTNEEAWKKICGGDE